MGDSNWLAERFEENREYLRGLAFRMLGSVAEADDAVQECWLRLSRSDSEQFGNLRAWLTTVVARICLDTMRSRKSKREEPLDVMVPEPASQQRHRVDPEAEAILADSVGHATLVVLLRLNPIERISFVLHDLFGVPFEEIARITRRSPDAVRQTASRARRRIRGNATVAEGELGEQVSLVEKFLDGLRRGDIDLLLDVLDPQAVVRADAAAGAGKDGVEIYGAEAWARNAIEAARGARLARAALVGGSVGLIMAPRGRLIKALRFSFANGRITAMEVIGDPQRLQEIEIAALER